MGTIRNTLFDRNLRGELEDRYIRTLLLKYKDANNYASAANHQWKDHINMTNFELRTYFRGIAFEDEIANWYLSYHDSEYNKLEQQPHHRYVPDMGTHFPVMVANQVEYFFSEYGDHLGIDKQNHGDNVKQWLHNLLMVVPHQNPLFYCMHCENEVNIIFINQQQQQHVCPRCGGWYLFEFERGNLPMVPSNWDLVNHRLEFPQTGQEFQQPPLRDDVIKEVDIGDLEDEHESCPICEEFYDVAVEKVIGKLPCGHIFHSDCVSNWFVKKHERRHCPECRRLMPTSDALFNIKLALYGLEENYPPPLP